MGMYYPENLVRYQAPSTYILLQLTGTATYGDGSMIVR